MTEKWANVSIQLAERQKVSCFKVRSFSKSKTHSSAKPKQRRKRNDRAQNERAVRKEIHKLMRKNAKITNTELGRRTGLNRRTIMNIRKAIDL